MGKRNRMEKNIDTSSVIVEDTQVNEEEILDQTGDEITEPEIVPEEKLDDNVQDNLDDTIEEQQQLLDNNVDTYSLNTISELSSVINEDPIVIITSLMQSSNIDLKVFGSELKDFVDSYAKKSSIESNNGNRRLFNLIVRTLKIENYEEFKIKFDVINKLFLSQEFFEPSILLQFTDWTKSEKDIANFAQIITIIEDLADTSTRQSNKKRIANFSNLSFGERSIENIKKYYKL